jgi:hypothetical protein
VILRHREGSRYLDVDFEDGEPLVRVMASSETGNAERSSATFRFDYFDKRYRVQIQISK